MPNILVVCTANICRSPVVQALLTKQLYTNGRTDFSVDSAGTWVTATRGAAQNSILLMAEQGLDISRHRAKVVDKTRIANADLVLCMASGHVEALQIEFPEFEERIYLLSEMAGKLYSIADPYGGSLKEYQEMVREVSQLIEKGLGQIIRLAEENAQKRSNAAADLPSTTPL